MNYQILQCVPIQGNYLLYGYLHLENTKDQRKTHWDIVYQLRNFFIPKIIVDFRTDFHKMKIKHRIIDEYAPKRCVFD
jgi:hypothetical protein